MIGAVVKAAAIGAALWGGLELIAQLFERDRDQRWDLREERDANEALERENARLRAEAAGREEPELDGPEDFRRDNVPQEGSSRRAAQPA